MMKKIVWFLLVYLMTGGICLAEDFQGGKVILDLQPNEKRSQTQSPMEEILSMGASYLYDVKEYNELLEGDELNKDFSADICSKYPQYDENTAKQWQDYVKKGVKAYRFYEKIKQKVIDWVMNREMPLVVADDQYEMGESEEYIETDKPLIIEDFKKVVAYSNQERDQLAAKEKRAKDHGWTRPSEVIARTKKAFLERDWKELFGFDFDRLIKEIYQKPDVRAGSFDTAAAVILPQFEGVSENEKIAGVIVIEPKEEGFVLLNDYENYKGLNVDFDRSENLAEVQMGFVMPQRIIAGRKEVLGYSGKFAIYFEGEPQDYHKPVVLQPKVTADICREDVCRKMVLRPSLTLQPKEENEKTFFATYVETVAHNIPQPRNAENFEFVRLVLDKGREQKPDVLRLEIKNNDPAHFKVSIVGKEAKYFAAPRVGIDGDNITVRFEILDKSFDPKDKEVTFLVSTGTVNQYRHKMKVGENEWLDTGAEKITAGILLLSVVGGLLLNLTPAVLAMLLIKMMAFAKFGGGDKKRVRRCFLGNVMGIAIVFLVAAVGLSGLKAAGYPLYWGMQFQNIYVLVALIWGIMLLLMQVVGIIDWRPRIFAARVLRTASRHEKMFEVLCGAAAAVVSVWFSGMILPDVFGLVFNQNEALPAAVVVAAGAGMALPYLIVAAFPKVFFRLLGGKKSFEKLRAAVMVALTAALIWLVLLQASQSAAKEIWHWLMYLSAAFVLLYFRKAVKTEIDKLTDVSIIKILHRRINIIFGCILVFFVALSMWDAGVTTAARRAMVGKIVPTVFEREYIDEILSEGGKVLVKIDADWCLLCRYNNAFVFDTGYAEDVFSQNKIAVLEIDGRGYDKNIFELMQSFGRGSLPFYVLFSSEFPEGMVLPKVFNARDFEELVGT